MYRLCASIVRPSLRPQSCSTIHPIEYRTVPIVTARQSHPQLHHHLQPSRCYSARTSSSIQSLRTCTALTRSSPCIPSTLMRRFSAAPQSQHPSDTSPASVTTTSSQQPSHSPSTNQIDTDEPIPRDWWGRWTHELPFPERGTSAWYKELVLLCVVFGVTGSSSMYFVKPLVKDVLGLEGSFAEGPWSYRLICIGVLMPAYSILLVTFGTLFGRHHYFKRQALKMWGRILPLHKLGIVAKPAPVARSVKSTSSAAAAPAASASSTHKTPTL